MKRFHQLSALALLLLAGSASLSAQQSVTPVDHVSTLVGSASKFSLSTGNTYPAIALPWGMNFWVPQTGKMGDGWQYTYDANQIRGLKQTHQPSPWINDYGQFAIMPTVGKVDFDEGINLLNQKDARVYIQPPTAARRAGLGSRVDLRLTLDEKKLAQYRAIAEKQAKEAAEERLLSEREHADSLAQAEFERAAAGSAEEQPADEPAAAGNDEGFFD